MSWKSSRSWMGRGGEGMGAGALSTLALLMLLAAALSLAEPQLAPQRYTTVYVMVEPGGKALVTFNAEGSLLSEWPSSGLRTSTQYLMSFPAGQYLYVTVEPYECYEVLAIDVSPQDAAARIEGDRAVIHLMADYVTVRIVLEDVPPERCEWVPIYGATRIRKDHLFYGSVGFVAASASAWACLEVRGRRRLKKLREELVRREVRKGLEHLRTDFVNAGVTGIDPLCHFVSMIIHPEYDLDRWDEESIYRAWTDDELLDGYLNTLIREMHGRSSPLTAFRGHAGVMPYLGAGLRAYLSILGLAPSTSKVLEKFIEEGEEFELKRRIGRDRIFEALIYAVKRYHDLHAEGLRAVYKLLAEREEFKRRLQSPHRYYATVLKHLEEESGYEIKLELKPVTMEEVGRKAEEDERMLEEAVRKMRGEAGKGPLELPRIKPTPRRFEIDPAAKIPDVVAEMLDRLREREERLYGGGGGGEASGGGREEADVELPRYLMKQVEALKIPLREVVESARRCAGGDARAVYREASRLADRHFKDVDENEKISIITILANMIPQVAKELQAGGRVEGEAEKPAAGERVEAGAGGRVGEKAEPAESKDVKVVEYRGKVSVLRGEVCLIPHFKLLPSFIVADMLGDRNHPVPISLKMGKILEEVGAGVASGKTPVITVPKRGYPHQRGKEYKTYYVRKLRQLIEVLKERRLLHYVGFLTLEKIYLKHGGFGLTGWDVKKLELARERADEVASLLSHLSREAVEALTIPAMLSQKVLDALLSPPKLESAMEEARRRRDGEAEAVYWALREVKRRQGRLKPFEVPREYGAYKIVLRQLGLVER